MIFHDTILAFQRRCLLLGCLTDRLVGIRVIAEGPRTDSPEAIVHILVMTTDLSAPVDTL